MHISNSMSPNRNLRTCERQRETGRQRLIQRQLDRKRARYRDRETETERATED